MRTNESGIQRIARRSAAMVMLQVRKRRKKPQPREQRPAIDVREVSGLVRARLHRAGIGGGGRDRRLAWCAAAPTRFAGRSS